MARWFTTCSGWAALVAIVSFLVVTVGVALVLVLVYRSLAEWKRRVVSCELWVVGSELKLETQHPPLIDLRLC